MAKNIVNLSLDGSNYTTRPYGICGTAAATAAKVVDCADFNLATGATVLVKFTYANSASSPTLNVNSTGAKSIYYRGAALASSLYYWGAGDVVEFYYNGTQWDLLNVSNSNTTYSALSAADATTGTATTGRLITAKVLHDKITEMLPSVPTISVTQTATSGNEVGKVTINGTDTTLYAPVQTTVSGNAGSATKLATSRTIDGVDFNGSANITHYAECSTAAGTAAKTVSLTGFKLATGAKVAVKFTVTNTASSPTLNVNSTGAKSIMYRGSAISAGYLAANRVYEFVYDGTDYELIGDLDTNTTYSGEKGITLSSGKFGHTNSVTEKTAYASSATTASANGGTIKLTDITYDSYGHITGSYDRTITLSEAYKGTVTSVTLSSGTGITVSDSGTAITGSGSRTVTLNTAATGTIGGIKIHKDNSSYSVTPNTSSISADISSGKYYAVEIDKNDKAFVYVPWQNDNTTYSAATTSANGLMTSAMVTKLNGIAENADNVSFTRSLTSGTKVGTITINGESTDLYCQTNTNTTYSASTGLSLNSSNAFSLNTAKTDTIGGIKIAKDNSSYAVTANTSPTISADVSGDKYYAVEIDKNDKAYVYVPWTDTNDNTQNTAGAGNKVDTKMFLVGRTAQSTGTSYSNVNVYIGTDNCLYSNGTKVSVDGHTHSQYLTSLPTHTHPYTDLTGSGTTANQAIVSSGTANGWKLYTLGAAASYGVATSVASGGTGLVTSGAVYTAITSGIKANDAMIFKGTLGTGGTVTSLPASHKIGDTYRVITAGTWAGVTCEVGDLVICTTAGTSASDSHWVVAQGNLDGVVIGPSSATSDRIATFNGTTGKSIKDSGKTIADLTYTAGTGLSLSSNAFSLATSGVTKGTYGPSSNVTGSEGNTISVPQIAVDEYGRITSIVSRTYTSKNTTYSAEKGIVLSSGKFGLEASGVTVNTDGTAKTYGNTDQQTPSHGGTFNIPYYTVDTYGRITAAGTTTVKLPGSGNTDTKVNVTLATTSKAYLIGVTSTPTSTATAMTAVSDTGVYLDTTAGTLTATAFNGNASSATYATNSRVTATTTAGTYYPTWTSGTAANTDYVLRGNSNFRYNVVAGTTSAEGYDSIYLGNSTAKGTANNSTGRLLLYSSSSSYHTLVGAATTSTIAHTLPATAGTILNTGTTSVTQKQTSGTEIATIKINNSDTKIYAPSIPSLGLGTEASNTTAGSLVKSIAVSGHTITVTKYTGTLGSGTKPIYFNSGVPTECSTYAGGTKVTLNGADKGASTASFYAPTAGGTAGQVLVSGGSSAPGWKDFSAVDLKTSSDVAAISKTITTSWAELVTAANMAKYCTATGTYVIQVSGSGIGTSSGVFSWSSGGTTEDEILLHRCGASTNIYLRLKNSALQIAGSAAISTAFTITVKVKRLI